MHIGSSAEQSWAVMQRMPGQDLEHAWPDMSEAARTRVATQIKAMVEELRAIKQDDGPWVGTCSRGSLSVPRGTDAITAGPFESVRDFHDFLNIPIRQHFPAERAQRLRAVYTDTCQVYFSHGNLIPEHIFVVPESGDITGVIDWDSAGFW
ncbi:hypothetical protein KVT40_000558 [Elsinoe batatas]|uniref:Aminoglycoside phosphotransferase domain-containing protein n=1 Tax=Elsinoe batatas TaxID=2601811 RepID=A0A8K0LFW2_9PEZI|nr:hypothetical protein KVT40_000558 [Elsinoe batatas]